MMKTTTAAALSLAIAACALGCRAEATRREGSRTVVVKAATQPAAPEPPFYDDGQRNPRRIDVVLTEPHGQAEGSPLAPLIGRNCKIQFRRDALGLAATAPVPPTGTGPGGRAVHMVGTVRSITAGWLVLENQQKEYWIPYPSILLVEVLESDPTPAKVERP